MERVVTRMEPVVTRRASWREPYPMEIVIELATPCAGVSVRR